MFAQKSIRTSLESIMTMHIGLTQVLWWLMKNTTDCLAVVTTIDIYAQIAASVFANSYRIKVGDE